MSKKVGLIEVGEGRIYGLDIMRALAILFVVLGHGNNLLFEKAAIAVDYFIFDGVTMFFVLSGFLIGGILIKLIETQQPMFSTLLNFWKRRWLRTLPAYYTVLILLVVLSWCFTKNYNFIGIERYFIFSQNLVTTQPPFFGESWSLSIEEWFYLFIPAAIFSLVVLLKMPAKKSVLVISIATISFSILLRSYFYFELNGSSVSIWENVVKFRVITRLDSIVFGVLGAYLAHYYKVFWHKNKIIFLAAGLLLFLTIKLMGTFGLDGMGFYFHVFYFVTGALASLFILPFLSELKTGSGLVYKAVTFFSVISYSMYLINLSLVQMWMLRCMSYLNPPGVYYTVLNYGLYWGFTVGGAFLLYKFVELPFMKLRKKI